MSAAQDAAQRLQRLERILAQSQPVSEATDGKEVDPSDVHLESVPIDRIRQVTSELQRRQDSDNDEIDAVAMQLLLNDYATAVTHLRAVVRLADQRIEAALVPIEEARRFVRKELKRAQEAPPAEVGTTASVDGDTKPIVESEPDITPPHGRS